MYTKTYQFWNTVVSALKNAQRQVNETQAPATAEFACAKHDELQGTFTISAPTQEALDIATNFLESHFNFKNLFTFQTNV